MPPPWPGNCRRPTSARACFPFSPFAHNNGHPNFGFTTGQRYTLRWAANPKLTANVCPGDNAQQWIDAVNAGGGSERGYIENNSAEIIRMAIEQDYQTAPSPWASR